MIGLTISGGSSKGAFALGVIQQLRRDWNIAFDVVSGTSTGALIAPFALSGLYAECQQFYTTLSARAFLEDRPPLDMVRLGSVFGTDGLKQVIDAAYTPALFAAVQARVQQGGFLFVTATNMKTGEVTHFWMGPREPGNTSGAKPRRIGTLEELKQAVYASASQPVIMPLVEIKGAQYGDGGVREVAPLQIVVDQGVDDLLGIVLTAENEQADEAHLDGLVATLKRTIGLLIEDVTANDMASARMHNQAVIYLRAVRQGIAGELKARADALGQDPAAQHIRDAAVAVDAIFGSVPANPFAGSRVLRLQLIRPQQKLLADSLHFSTNDMRRMVRAGEDLAGDLFPPNSGGPFPAQAAGAGPIV